MKHSLIRLLKWLLKDTHKHSSPPLVEYPPIIDKIVFDLDVYTLIDMTPRMQVRIKEVLMMYFLDTK